ncbi:MAG: carbonic anhydrase [Chloroflexota bacterium]
MKPVQHPFKPAFIGLFIILIVNGLLMFSIASAQTTDPTPAPAHWTYEGDEGPDAWGNLDANYALCGTGRAQSPIDVSGAEAIGLQDIQFNYQPSALNIFNNGHTIQANYDAGSSIVYNETEYQLIQFHFHHPSEHTIDGKAFDMELHLVHRDANGNLAVVGILLQKGDADNAALAPVFDHLPAQAGDPQDVGVKIDASAFLPNSHLFYTYAGSLTTPPCSQGVRWLLLETPVTISDAQFEAFASLFEMNVRPVQPLNNRDLLEDNTAGS